LAAEAVGAFLSHVRIVPSAGFDKLAEQVVVAQIPTVQIGFEDRGEEIELHIEQAIGDRGAVKFMGHTQVGPRNEKSPECNAFGAPQK